MKTFEDCIKFHGHTCPGLATGYAASKFILNYLDIEHSEDEDLVCIAENDACGIDAIQVMTGCSIGKGNLMFKITGKSAYNFFDRNTGKSVRIISKEYDKNMSRNEKIEYLIHTDPDKLFNITDVKVSIPEKARLFDNVRCEECKELASENNIRFQGGKKVCLDCYDEYVRINI